MTGKSASIFHRAATLDISKPLASQLTACAYIMADTSNSTSTGQPGYKMRSDTACNTCRKSKTKVRILIYRFAGKYLLYRLQVLQPPHGNLCNMFRAGHQMRIQQGRRSNAISNNCDGAYRRSGPELIFERFSPEHRVPVSRRNVNFVS
jgi:hypothetical protein